MKKIAILAILCLFAVNMASAQKKEVNRAKRQLGRGNLEMAWQHISNAVNHPVTSVDPSTWTLRSRILIEIAATQIPAYQNLVAEPLELAYESVRKAQGFTLNPAQLLEVNQTLLSLSENMFNAGAIAYQQQRYAKASDYFLGSYRINEGFGAPDTATLYNAGLSAEIAGLYDKAYDFYVMAEELKYEQPFMYGSLSGISLRRGDIENAEKWVKIGRQRFPDNLELIFAEANVYLTSGNIPEARRVLQLAIERDPDNPNLFYAFAVNYDQMSRDSLFSRADQEFAYNEAIKAYKRAIELNPEYFDAYYNLGALYFNEGIRLFVEADNILRKGYSNENLRKSSALEDESKKLWKEYAQPYLEKAYSMLKDDNNYYEIVLRSLRELYMRTGQLEKLEATNEIWKTKFQKEN